MSQRPPRKRRYGMAVVLVIAGGLLLGSIQIGERLGDRVLRQSTETRLPVVAAPVTTAPPVESAKARTWKREQIVVVATDPAFPDPRVTPTPPPTPRPRPATPKPQATPPPRPTARAEEPATSPSANANSTYTSPPLPVPLSPHSPGPTFSQGTPSPDEGPNPP